MRESLNANESLFSKDYIFLDVDLNNTDEVFDFIHDQMSKMGLVNKNFNEALKEREKRFPTGLEGKVCSIAVPHTDPKYIKRPFIALIRPKKSIKFTEMASNDKTLNVQLIFVLGYKDGKYQVKLLSAIIDSFVIQCNKSKNLINVQTKEEAYDMLVSLENSIIRV